MLIWAFSWILLAVRKILRWLSVFVHLLLLLYYQAGFYKSPLLMKQLPHILYTEALAGPLGWWHSAMSVPVNPPHDETDSLHCRGTLTISARRNSPFYFLKRGLSLPCSQQDMKDEQITDRDGQKPKADTIGVMAISAAGAREPLVIRDVPGNLFSCAHAWAIIAGTK